MTGANKNRLLGATTMKLPLHHVGRILLLGAAAVAAVLAAGAYTILHTPSWYRIPVIPVEDRQQVRNNLVAAEQAFTEALRTSPGPFVYHVFQDDVNRWIAMRREIYPLIDELAPPELADPMVLFGDGVITFAGRYKKGRSDVVVSVDVSVRFAADAIVLKVEALRCGSMRVSPHFAELGLDRPIERPAGTVWPGSPRMWGDFMTGFYVASRAWWKNGGIDYQVCDARIEPGRLNLTIEPLMDHSANRRKDHP